jgi:hypothetical protein
LAVDDYANVVRVVESYPVAVERSLEVKQRYAWRLLHLGRLSEARNIANSLKADVKTPRRLRAPRLVIALANG